MDQERKSNEQHVSVPKSYQRDAVYNESANHYFDPADVRRRALVAAEQFPRLSVEDREEGEIGPAYLLPYVERDIQADTEQAALGLLSTEQGARR